jgi:S1-C subfamily serine protease
MKRLRIAAITLLMVRPMLSQDLSAGIRLGGGSSAACPVLITDVGPGSPADRAGVKSGDILLAVNGSQVATIEESSKILDTGAQSPNVVLRLKRDDTVYTATVERENLSDALRRSGLKELSMGMIAPLDATESEMQGKIKTISQDRFADRVFPSHYPTNERLYYAGFEVLILKNPPQVVVLGIEDGPASRAGVHWGDTILAVNSVDPRGKSVSELERVFSSAQPVPMSLKVERGSLTKVYEFELEEAVQVLRDNGKQIYRGDTMPVGIPEKYLPCFRP